MRILSRQYSGNAQAFWQDRRHILAAVHRQIDLSIQQRIFNLFHEQSLAASFGERCFL